jgi:hypothetical protein
MRPLVAALFTVALTVFAKTNAPSSAVSDDDSEAYAIYAAVLADDPLVTHAKPELLVVQRETEAAQLCGGWDSASQPLFGSSLADYQAKAKTTWLLQPRLTSLLPIVIVPIGETTNLPESSGLPTTAYKRKYPGSDGYVIFSAVGFNADKTVAVLSGTFVSYAGPTRSFSGGEFIVLQKKDGRWQPADWPHMGCASASAGGIVY